MASLKDDLDELRNELKESKDETRNLEIENGNLKQIINLNILQLDDLQQYSDEKTLEYMVSRNCNLKLTMARKYSNYGNF